MIKAMTWAQLRDAINNMSEEQKGTDVTLFDPNDDEFYGLCRLEFVNAEEENRLDADHPYLTIFA